KSPRRASSTIITCCMRRARTCYAVSDTTRRPPKVTSSRSVLRAMIVSAAFSNAACARSARPFLSLRASGAVKFREPFGHLVFRHVFLVRRDGPDVPKRIRQRPGTIAVKLILQRLHLGSPRIDGLLVDRIHVLDVNHDAHRSAAK